MSEDFTFQIEEHLTHDLEVTLRGYGILPHGLDDSMHESLLEDLVRDCMHQIDKIIDTSAP